MAGQTLPALLAGCVVRRLAPCGTDSAYSRHCRLGEPVDDLCRAAHQAKMREWRARAGITEAHRADAAARSRAKSRLAAEHPARYAALYAEELARGTAPEAAS